ncbi:MAG: single-stranded DNA-binding protein [Bacteroidetes bacterium]|nr:single-stranded DNA-binding protein [Bacteroidota bacterium]
MKNLRNSVQIIGYVGNAPEVRELNGGKMMARFSVATHEFYKNAAGEKVENTTWHNFVAWGTTAKYISQYVAKGREIAVEGKLTNRSYEDKNGEKRNVTEIEVNNVLLLGKKD